jgi:hypothetical protein
MADAFADSWRLPFNTSSRFGSLLGRGRCVQGNDGFESHTQTLRYAYDFSLPTGTPVLASRSGVVAAACGVYRRGGLRLELKGRANHVVLRHGDRLYSRYYHLAPGGVAVAVGQAVAAGDVIGRSGNTGYSGGPHLHWDVVDVEPQETAMLTLHADSPATARELGCAAAGFSGVLPPCEAPAVEGPAVWADPPTASADLRNPAAELEGAVVLIERCAEVDFLDKARRAAAAGAAAAVVVNTQAAGPELLTMSVPKVLTMRPEEYRLPLPCLMVTHLSGTEVRGAIESRRAAGALPPRLAVGRSPHFRPRRPEEAEAALGRGLSEFVPLTQPARFLWPGGRADGYQPRAGEVPPPAVQRAGRAAGRASGRVPASPAVITVLSASAPRDQGRGPWAWTPRVKGN